MRAYTYRFVQNFDASAESGDIQTRILFSFKSPMSKQTYYVWVDKCAYNIYVIKFHLKNHRLSKYKYNILTNLGEARNVLYTCITILINEFYNKDNMASFGFVASNLKDEGYANTKRLHFYEKFITTFIGGSKFEHYKYEEQSVYLLVSRYAIDRNPNLINTYFEMLQRHSFIN